MADVAVDPAVETAHGGPAVPEAQGPGPAARPERECALVALSHIRLHPLNLRKELRDIDELADSIRQNGLLQPLVLVPDPESGGDEEGIYLLVAGHRRYDACVKAKHDPVQAIIRRDLEGEGAQVLVMLTENGPRDDLSAIEEAHGYQLALGLNQLTPAKLARRLGKPTDKVKSRIALTRLPEHVQERVHTRQLNLADAEAMVEFANDAKFLEELLGKAGTQSFRFRIEQERHRRQREAKIAELRRQLAAAGAHVIDEPDGYAWSSTEKPVAAYIDPNAEPGPDGQPVQFNPETHAAVCPLHAVFIRYDAEPVYVCRDPREAGHRSIHERAAAAPSPAPDSNVAEAEAERLRPDEDRRRQAEEAERQRAQAAAAEAERREALEVAGRLRHGFVTTLVRRSGKAHLQAVLGLLLIENFEAWLDDVEMEDVRQLAELIDAKLPDGDEWDTDLWEEVVRDLRAALFTRRAPDAIAGALLAIVANDREQALTEGYGWSNQTCRRYIDWLIAQGYEPTDHERELLEADE